MNDADKQELKAAIRMLFVAMMAQQEMEARAARGPAPTKPAVKVSNEYVPGEMAAYLTALAHPNEPS